jgi:hypothetical protein
MAILLFIVMACSKSESTNMVIWIGPERVDCVGLTEQSCYLISFDTRPGDWEFFYDGISGFDDQYEVGYVYQLEVQRTSVKNPPEDASAFEYRLVRIISKQANPI